MYQIREVLEIGTVRIIIKTITEKQLQEIKGASDLLDSACQARNVEVYQEADIQFHRLLVHLTENERMEIFFESVA